MTILSDIDLVIFPIYFILITIGVFFYNYYFIEAKYQSNFILSYFIKVICTIAFAFLFNNYYQSGDTINFYNDAEQLKLFIFQDLDNIKYFWRPTREFWNVCENCIICFSDSSFFIVKIASILLIPTFGSYLSAALILGLLSHLGTYKIIQTFSIIFPKINFSILFFIPSVLLWSSGIMKDGLCIFALGYLFNILESSFQKKTISFFSIIFLVLLSYMLLVLKGYILISFMFCYVIRIFLLFKSIFESKLMAVIFGMFVGILVIFAAINLSAISDKFVFENLLELSVYTQKAIFDLQGGSTYEITYDLTPLGIIWAIVQSFAVSFFRPFIWEASNPFLLLFCFENSLMCGFLLFVLIKRKLQQKKDRISIQPIITFCLLFSVIFGITVGFTSSNFGALMRYKIPYLLFYLSAIIVLYDGTKQK